MKIKVETNIKGFFSRSFYKIPILGKILSSFFWRKIPAIEGYEALFNIRYIDVDSKKYPILFIKPVIWAPHGIEGEIKRWAYKPWFPVNNLTMKFYPPISGYIELRVYFKDLKNSDEIIDDFERCQSFKEDIGTDKNISYYYKVFRIYSLSEVLMIVLTGVVTFFTILLFMLSIINLIILISI